MFVLGRVVFYVVLWSRSSCLFSHNISQVFVRLSTDLLSSKSLICINYYLFFLLDRPDPEFDLYPSPGREVKLDTVVTMIDSVTDEMTFYKEKVSHRPENNTLVYNYSHFFLYFS